MTTISSAGIVCPTTEATARGRSKAALCAGMMTETSGLAVMGASAGMMRAPR
jgi:hypothetical protein